MNEFVIASALIQTTRPLHAAASGCARSSTSSTPSSGAPFAAGVLLAAIPAVLAVRLPAAVHRLRAHARRGQGMSVAAEPSARRTACSPSRTTTARTRTCSSGRTSSAARRSSACACRAATGVDAVALRYVRDGEPRAVAAEVDEETEHRDLVARDLPRLEPVHARYRWLLAGGDVGYAWVNGARGRDPRRGRRGRLRALARPGRARLAPRSVVYQIFPDRFASSGLDVERAGVGDPAGWDELPTGRGAADAARVVRRRPLRRSSEHLDHVERLGANVLYLTPIFPAGSTHRYDAWSFEPRRPAARRRRRRSRR